MPDLFYITKRRDGKVWTVNVVIYGQIICSAQAIATDDEPDPSGTAVAKALTKFHQLIGEDIRQV